MWGITLTVFFDVTNKEKEVTAESILKTISLQLLFKAGQGWTAFLHTKNSILSLLVVGIQYSRTIKSTYRSKSLQSRLVVFFRSQ